MGKFLRSALCALAAAALASGGGALAAAPDSVVPMGDVAGISIASRGAVVIGVTSVVTENGEAYPARDAGIMPGDVIIGVDSREIGSAAELKAATMKLGGEKAVITVERGGDKKQFTVSVHRGEDGAGALGVWLRDTLTGMGTITFYDPASGVFGALGHSVSDVDTGVLLPLREGVIMNAAVTDIVAGRNGEPGQLCGDLDFSHATGVVSGNTPVGVYGTAKLEAARAALPVAREAEIKTGTASILSGALGEVTEYSVEIIRVYSGGGARDMMLRVTDERLLDTTGGIVQGMSGSPIIQNGKLIGAVTHVLVNDSAKGYGVSAEDMLEAAFGDSATMAA